MLTEKIWHHVRVGDFLERALCYIMCSFCADRALLLLTTLQHEMLLRQECAWDSGFLVS